MKKTILFIIIIIFALITNEAISQIGGLSGTKLSAVCYDVVDLHKIEFEPGVFHVVSKNIWDSNGNLQDLYGSDDSVRHLTGLNFRFTYGLLDKLEIGMAISSDLQQSNLGLRYALFHKNKLGIALIAGANIPLGNKTFDKSINISDNLTSVGGGAVLSTQFNENFSLDFNAQYMTFVEQTDENHKGSYYVNADLGYYLFKHQFQIIGGLGYQQASYEEFTEKKFTVYPGVSIETGKNYLIVIGVPFDIYGENTIKNSGLTFALTLTFD